MTTAAKLVLLCLVACVLDVYARAQPSRAQPSRAQPSIERQLRELQANGSDVLSGVVNVLADSAEAMRGALRGSARHTNAPIEWHRQDELMSLTPSADQALVVRFYVMPYVMDFVEQVLASGVEYTPFGYQRFVEEPEWLLKYHLTPLDFHAARRACADEGARLYHGHAHSVELDTRMAVFYPTLQPWFGEEKESAEGVNHCNYLTYVEGVAQKWDKCSRPHPFVCERRLSDDYQPFDTSAPAEASPWPAPPCLNQPDCLDPPPPPSGFEPPHCFVPPCPDIAEITPVIAEVDDGSLEPKPFPLRHSEVPVDEPNPLPLPHSEVPVDEPKPLLLPHSEVPVDLTPVELKISEVSVEPKPVTSPQSEVSADLKPVPLPHSEKTAEPKPFPLPHSEPTHDHSGHEGLEGHEGHKGHEGQPKPSAEQLQKVDDEFADIMHLATSVQQLLDVVASPESTGIRTTMAKRQRPILLMRKILGVTQTEHAQIRARLDALSPAQRASLGKAVRAHSAAIARWNADRELLNRYVEKVSGKQQLIIPELNLLLVKLGPLKAKS